MQYCSLQHWTLLLPPVISTTGCCFCFGSTSSFFLELFLHWSPVAYWAPTDRRSLSFSVLSFCIFIMFMGFSRQEYWSGLPFPSPVGRPHFVRSLHHDPSILGAYGTLFYCSNFEVCLCIYLAKPTILLIFQSWISIYKPLFLHIIFKWLLRFHLAGVFIHFACIYRLRQGERHFSSPLVFSYLSYLSWLLDPFTPSDKVESEAWGHSCPRREHGSLGLNNPSEWVSRGPKGKFGCCFLPGSLSPSEGGGGWRYVTESSASLYISVESNSWRQTFGCSRKGESRQHIKKQRHYCADQGLSSDRCKEIEKTTEWERLEISSRKLDMPREHFMQRWAR